MWTSKFGCHHPEKLCPGRGGGRRGGKPLFIQKLANNALLKVIRSVFRRRHQQVQKPRDLQAARAARGTLSLLPLLFIQDESFWFKAYQKIKCHPDSLNTGFCEGYLICKYESRKTEFVKLQKETLFFNIFFLIITRDVAIKSF